MIVGGESPTNPRPSPISQTLHVYPCMPYMPISWGGFWGSKERHIYGSPMNCLGYPLLESSTSCPWGPTTGPQKSGSQRLFNQFQPFCWLQPVNVVVILQGYNTESQGFRAWDKHSTPANRLIQFLKHERSTPNFSNEKAPLVKHGPS